MNFFIFNYFLILNNTNFAISGSETISQVNILKVKISLFTHKQCSNDISLKSNI